MGAEIVVAEGRPSIGQDWTLASDGSMIIITYVERWPHYFATTNE